MSFEYIKYKYYENSFRIFFIFKQSIFEKQSYIICKKTLFTNKRKNFKKLKKRQSLKTNLKEKYCVSIFNFYCFYIKQMKKIPNIYGKIKKKDCESQLLQLQVVMIIQSIYGMLKQDNKKQNQMFIEILSVEYISHQMELLQHLVVKITQSDYGMLKQDNKQLNQMVIVELQYQYASHQMELLQHLVVMISQSDYGMLKQDNKKPNQMVIKIIILQMVPIINCFYQILILIFQQYFNKPYFKQIVLYFIRIFCKSIINRFKIIIQIQKKFYF
ncbi:unnamed protein product [Paramecium sonneborni]|uniref:Transmembrane protein n=1 Tax=Paramecium sonneborni TaxID=65129 RepID=A0A8S1QQL0_9CILI|nr:unnamed protein product [Paramecium sonneborni]